MPSVSLEFGRQNGSVRTGWSTEGRWAENDRPGSCASLDGGFPEARAVLSLAHGRSPVSLLPSFSLAGKLKALYGPQALCHRIRPHKQMSELPSSSGQSNILLRGYTTFL